jgi:DNA-directed RNA polymerase subunit RPC12/RpoP
MSHKEEYIIERRKGRDSMDVLDEGVRSEDEELVREAKRKRLEEVILERQARIEELKRKMGKSNEGSTSAAPLTTAGLATTLIQGGVSPEKVNEFLKKLDPQALGALIALSSNNPALAMMAFAMNQQRTEPLTVKDVIAISKELHREGVQPNINIDVAKLVEAAKTQPQGIDVTQMTKAIVDAIKTGIEVAKVATPKAEKEEGWFEKLISSPEGIKTAKELGLFGGQNIEYLKLLKEMKESDRRFAREMKESDRRFELLLKKMEEEKEQRRVKAALERHKTEMISGALQRVGRAIARGLSEAGEASPEAGETAEGEVVEGKAAPKAKGKNVHTYKCEDCGAPISVPADAKKGTKIVCARCGAEFILE